MRNITQKKYIENYVIAYNSDETVSRDQPMFDEMFKGHSKQIKTINSSTRPVKQPGELPLGALNGLKKSPWEILAGGKMLRGIVKKERDL